MLETKTTDAYGYFRMEGGKRMHEIYSDGRRVAKIDEYPGHFLMEWSVSLNGEDYLRELADMQKHMSAEGEEMRMIIEDSDGNVSYTSLQDAIGKVRSNSLRMIAISMGDADGVAGYRKGKEESLFVFSQFNVSNLPNFIKRSSCVNSFTEEEMKHELQRALKDFP